MPDLSPAGISLIVTLLGLVVSGVWFVARLAEQLRQRMDECDAEIKRDLVGTLEGASRARDQQMGGLAVDLREVSRSSASREELRIVENRISEALRRMEGKLDAVSEKVASTGHLNDAVRHLAGRIEQLDQRERPERPARSAARAG